MPPDPQPGHLPGAAIIRAAAFDKYGLLDERLAVNADLDWWVRARDEGARVRLIEVWLSIGVSMGGTLRS